MTQKRYLAGGRIARSKRLKKKRRKAILELWDSIPVLRGAECSWSEMVLAKDAP